MTEKVVDSLSGEARDFYNKEFTFFNEVTSISGKLKPFIKKTKPEKKVEGYYFSDMALTFFLRQKSMKRWQKLSLKLGSICRVILTEKW
jgi:hypothetical protein